jgi:hypothetical protein
MKLGLTVCLLFNLNVFVTAGTGEETAMSERCTIYQSQQKVKLVYLPLTSQLVKVKIFDAENNDLVMSEIINPEKGFSKIYNLQELKSGKYVMEVWQENQSVRKELECVNEKSTAPSASIEWQDDYTKASVSVQNAEEEVRVNIFNSKHRLIFSEVIHEKGNFAKLYDLSALGDQEMLMEISEGKKVIKRSFL